MHLLIYSFHNTVTLFPDLIRYSFHPPSFHTIPCPLFSFPSPPTHFLPHHTHTPLSLLHPLQNFFPDLGSNAKDIDPRKKAERAKKIMMQEYFSESGRVPEVEGVLYMKEGLKKPWKKYFFMLRASGLYHSTKGKSKVSWKSLVKVAGVCM